MGLLYSVGVRIVNFVVFFLIVVLLPGLPPRTDFPFKEFQVTPSKELKGSLEFNNHLDNAERLLDGRVYGPECLIARKNEVFTSIHGGEVIKITADHITHVAKFGQPCEGIYEEAKCGRPLGLAFDTIGNNLIVADAYYGIWQVNLANGRKKLLISPHQTFEGKIERKARIFNTVAVDKQGDIYWTDSSSDFSIENGLYTMLANPSGRLFHYDRNKNHSKVLIDELFFANGVALSPNEDFIVVAETGGSRLMKYHLKGPKKGASEVFSDGLPGCPDNLTPDAEGLWVPLVTTRDSDNPSIFQSLTPFPMMRLFVARLFALFEMPFRFFNNAFPNSYTQKVLHFAGHFESFKGILPKRSTILRLDWNGNIIGSLHGFDKSARFISHVLEFEDSLLLGSPFNRYLAKVRHPKSPQIKIRNVRYEGMEPVVPKPSKEKAAPTTTTPPPPPKTTPTPKSTTTSRAPTTTQAPKTAKATVTPAPTTTPPPPKPTTTTPKPAQVKQPTTTQAPPTRPTPARKPITTTPAPTKKTESKEGPRSATTTPPPPPTKPKEPAPIKEKIVRDTTPPPPEKLKVIKRGGEQGEL